jgi:hypothetical protein
MTLKGITMKVTPWAARPLALLASALLAACGGGGGGAAPAVTDPPFARTDVPTSATASPAGALAFVKTVAAATGNDAEPIAVGDAVLATSDTDESDPGI